MRKTSGMAMVMLVIAILFACPNALTQTDHLEKAKREMALLKIGRTVAHLDTILSTDPANREANYLMAEILLLSGNEDYKKQMTILKEIGASEELTVIKAKEALFIGDSRTGQIITEAINKYPDNAEIKYTEWLFDIDNNGIGTRAGEAASLSEGMIVRTLPWLALYLYSRDTDPALAISYLNTLEASNVTIYQSRDKPLLEMLTQLPSEPEFHGEFELEYADCGPGMGFYMTDSKGSKIKMEMDTGSGSNLFTIHNDSIGRALDGEQLLTIEDGISFNYMESAEDIHYKLVDFTNPAISNIVTGYFRGSLTKADGCFSPFSLGRVALTIDPVNKQAWLRDSLSLEQYLEQRDSYTMVKYIIRNGWIYIPCTINNKEVLMMVETGSRDVNLNSISAPLLGIEPYDGFIKWRGEDYPVSMVDFMLKVGDIMYEVKSGHVTSFVLGNNYTGQASAGDIGPVFFRNFT